MKRILATMTTIAALTMVSCVKEQIVEPGTGVAGNDVITAFTEENLTKTTLDGNDTEGYEVIWTEGDKFYIGENKFTLIDGEGTTKGTFQGTLPTDGTYSVSYNEGNGNWPTFRIHSEDRIICGPMTATVTISDGKVSEPLKFRNEGGILRLTLKGTATVTEIIVYIGTKQYNFRCGGGVSLDNENGKVFYLPLPADTYGEPLLQFYTIDGLDIRKQMKYGKTLVIERSKITDISLSGINSTTPAGILSGKFSVAEGSQVHFSKGNLRYTVDSGKWSFFDRQYDCGPSDYEDGHDKEISLFTWGYNSTKSIIPDGSDSDNVSITPGDVLLLPQDWGSRIGETGTWRTLTSAEWKYLFKTRTDADKKYGLATVCGVKGLIILPDAFTDPMKNKGSEAFKPKVTRSWTSNVYTSGENWGAMEYAGAVFLPAAGYRQVADISQHASAGYYWSSSSYHDKYVDDSNVIEFDEFGYFGLDHHGRNYGSSVRLVTGEYTVTFDLNGVSGTAPQSIKGILYGSHITKPINSPTSNKYAFTGWYKEPECTTPWDFTNDCVTANTTIYAGWTGGLISGKFSVAGNKQVYFSMGNLWADGSNALHFESEQWGFNSKYESGHVSHFTWSDSANGACGTSGSGNHLFCDESHKVSVNGSSPIYRALSKDEWTYLLNLDGNGRIMKLGMPTHTINVRYGNGTDMKTGIVIYPDNYIGEVLTPEQDYTEETFPEGCVFLPGAGWRNGNTVAFPGDNNGFYWSSSAQAGQPVKPYNLELTHTTVNISAPGSQNSGFTIRLVTNVE